MDLLTSTPPVFCAVPRCATLDRRPCRHLGEGTAAARIWLETATLRDELPV